MRRLLAVYIVTVLTIGVLAGCAATPDEKAEPIKEYLLENCEYPISDLRVIMREENDYAVEIVATMSGGEDPQELLPFTEHMIFLSEQITQEHGVTLDNVNTILTFPDDSYVGWSSRNGSIYTNKRRGPENVSIEELSIEIDNLFADTLSYTSNEEIQVSIRNYMSQNSEVPLHLSQVLVDKDGSFQIFASHSIMDKEAEGILDEFDVFVKDEFALATDAAKDNNAAVSLISIAVTDDEDKTILMWTTSNLETGLLSDRRGDDNITHENIRIEEIRGLLYAD